MIRSSRAFLPPLASILACSFVAVFGLALTVPVFAAQAARAASADPAALARVWDAEHVSAPLPPLLTHRDVVAQIAKIKQTAPDLFSEEVVGKSVEGRDLHHVWFGHGPTHILLWSQMHGDEPTATAALFDIFDYVTRHRQDATVKRMLEALTIHVVPMLNPDGAERYQRRNAQEIDINRDALHLQTPEGRALKALRDRLNPLLGFNLHNQNWRTSVSTPPKPASISLLAVVHDAAKTDDERRILSKKVIAVIRDAIEPMIPGQIGKYDDDFEVRAFGDNIAKWGTAVVLIETGAAPGAEPDKTLVRVNFVAILTALDAVASGRVKGADPGRYDSLPYNESKLLHTVVTNATIVQGTSVPPFTGDVGIAATRIVRREGGPSGERRLSLSARIDDVGDLRTYGALESIDGTGLTLAPLFDEHARENGTIRLPNWAEWKGPTIQIGQPGNLLLLKPLPGNSGEYQVVRVIRLSNR
jgi:Zinc carboxypeptidase